MERYSTYARQPYAAAMATRSQRGTRASSYNLKNSDLHDDMGSVSGSEDGNYPLLHDFVKQEVDNDHGADQDLSLTSQTLNADGTPKRPMNAFMIFARKRRPQVSAQNQSMRTGEISKLLSKEWSSMPSSEKQFYQDQARLLKDSFNSKYPDYVYRRRPNNSKRRRRSDAARPGDNGHGDTGGDSGGEFESPVDPDGYADADGESVYSRGSREPPNYPELPLKYPPGPSISRSSTHPFQSNHPYYRGSEPRLPYRHVSDRPGHSLPHRLSNPSMNYSLSSSSSYSTDLGSPQTWNSRPDRGSSNWSSGQGRIPLSLKTGSYGGSSTSGGWSSSLPSSSSYTYSSSSSNFSTLNTPFYPSQSNMSDYGASDSSNGSSSFDSLALSPITNERVSYESRSDALASEPLTYPASRNMSRVLPPVASISGYPSSVPSATSSSQPYLSRA
ncbi:hypothetical protein NMY22_g7567 [Coprinellus aureogranulatus]|nr:hypothetical protein NMY22_g7567 [Coprinellus aureogranulatus]